MSSWTWWQCSLKSERERDTRFKFLNNVCRTFCSINQSVVESLQHTATCWNKNKHQLAHQVDLATVMAEMFKIGDRNKDDVLTRLDFLHLNTLGGLLLFSPGRSLWMVCWNIRSHQKFSGSRRSMRSWTQCDWNRSSMKMHTFIVGNTKLNRIIWAHNQPHTIPLEAE